MANPKRWRGSSPPVAPTSVYMVRGRQRIPLNILTAWGVRSRSEVSPPPPPIEKRRMMMLRRPTRSLLTSLIHRGRAAEEVEVHPRVFEDEDDGALWFESTTSITPPSSPCDEEQPSSSSSSSMVFIDSFVSPIEPTITLPHTHPLNVSCDCGVQATCPSAITLPQRSASYCASATPPISPTSSNAHPCLPPTSSDPISATLIRSLSTAKLCQHGRPMCQLVGIVNLTHRLPEMVSCDTPLISKAELRHRRKAARSKSRRRSSWHGDDRRGRDASNCGGSASIVTLHSSSLWVEEAGVTNTSLSTLAKHLHLPCASVRCRSPLRFGFSVDDAQPRSLHAEPSTLSFEGDEGGWRVGRRSPDEAESSSSSEEETNHDAFTLFSTSFPAAAPAMCPAVRIVAEEPELSRRRRGSRDLSPDARRDRRRGSRDHSGDGDGLSPRRRRGGREGELSGERLSPHRRGGREMSADRLSPLRGGSRSRGGSGERLSPQRRGGRDVSREKLSPRRRSRDHSVGKRSPQRRGVRDVSREKLSPRRRSRDHSVGKRSPQRRGGRDGSEDRRSPQRRESRNQSIDKRSPHRPAIRDPSSDNPSSWHHRDRSSDNLRPSPRGTSPKPDLKPNLSLDNHNPTTDNQSPSPRIPSLKPDLIRSPSPPPLPSTPPPDLPTIIRDDQPPASRSPHPPLRYDSIFAGMDGVNLGTAETVKMCMSPETSGDESVTIRRRNASVSPLLLPEVRDVPPLPFGGGGGVAVDVGGGRGRRGEEVEEEEGGGGGSGVVVIGSLADSAIVLVDEAGVVPLTPSGVAGGGGGGGVKAGVVTGGLMSALGPSASARFWAV
ncbi:hypothetical protein HDU67_009241 [Dinochytrium kinnereticum]|nr:hypothetical protein HDU67_009241 [Dinochytrium kinnereticum]